MFDPWHAIARATARCSVAIPESFALDLDLDWVNVEWSEGEQTTRLRYDPSCSKKGWHYDDGVAPASVELCAEVCEELGPLLTAGDATLTLISGTLPRPGSTRPERALPGYRKFSCAR